MSLPTSSPSAPPRAPSGPPRASSGRRRFALRIVASLLVLGVLASLLDRGEIFARLSDFVRRSPLVWAGSLALFVLLHAGGAMKWRLFLSLASPTSGRLPVRSALRFYAAGLFANLCLPTMIGGDVVRAGLALGASKEKEAVVLGSLADRLADLLALGILSAAAAALSPSAREALAQRSISPATIVVAFVGLLLAGVVALVLLLRASASTRLSARFAKVMGEVRGAAAALRGRPGPAVLGFLLCLALQSGFILLNAWIGGAIGIDLDLAAWFLVVPLAKIAAMLPLSLGGIGVREVAVGELMAPLGVAREIAVAQSLVWQSVLVAGSLAAGVFAAAAGEGKRGRS
ncbi:MAG: YbhN family protein [Planctomycetota bacterium]